MLTLTFLGTSAGVPTKYRNVTALAITATHTHSRLKHPAWLLIDCGEGTQHQLLHTPLSLSCLRLIAITHVHGDHCYGLAGLLASMAMAGRTAPLTILAPQAIAKLLDTLTITTDLYFSFAIEFIAIESLLLDESHHSSASINRSVTHPSPDAKNASYHPLVLTLGDDHQLSILPIALSHRTPSYAFKISQKLQTTLLDGDKLIQLGYPPSQLWGQLRRGQDVPLGNGKSLTSSDFVSQATVYTRIIVAGDNDTPERLSHEVDDISLLVHEATYTQAVADKIGNRGDGYDPMHSSAKRIASFAQDEAIAHMIFTHFSGRYQPYQDVTDNTPNMGHIRTEVEQYYHGKYWLANDFDSFSVNQQQVKFLGNQRALG